MTSTWLARRVSLLALLLFSGLASGARAQVPGGVSYQGRLTDSTGTPVNGSVTMTFKLYGQAASTVPLWTETQTVTPVNGFFAAHLGDTDNNGTPFASTVWTGAVRYLGITVGSDSELSPRAKLLSAPYALLAAPTPHAQNHRFGGGDEIAVAAPTANSIPLSDSSGKLAPGWLPAATTSASGAVALGADGATSGVVQGSDSRLSNSRPPTSHGASHKSGGSDEIASSVHTANGIPKADSLGHLDLGWIPTSPMAVAGAIPSGSGATGANGALDLSWIPASSSARANFVPVGSSSGTIDLTWIPTSAGAGSGLIPRGSASGPIDPSWLGTVGLTNGGTGSASPRVARNLCFYLAGPPPTALAQAPTLQVPPGLSGCTAVQAYGSVAVAPTAAVGWTFQKVSGNTGTNVLAGSWPANSNAATPVTGSMTLSASDVLAPVFSSTSISNATVCLQILCGAGFQ